MADLPFSQLLAGLTSGGLVNKKNEELSRGLNLPLGVMNSRIHNVAISKCGIASAVFLISFTDCHSIRPCQLTFFTLVN